MKQELQATIAGTMVILCALGLVYLNHWISQQTAKETRQAYISGQLDMAQSIINIHQHEEK